jgi:PKD repeat protein
MVECDGGNIDVGASGFSASSYINTELCLRPSAKAKGGVTYYFALRDCGNSSPIPCSQYAALTMEAYDPPEAPKIVSAMNSVTVSVEKVGYGNNDLPEKTYRVLTSGSEPIRYEAQNLPAGYALFGDTIADDGTPSTPGTHSVTLTVRNAYGSDTKTLSLTVADAQVPAYRTLLSGEVGKPFRFDAPMAGTAPIGCRVDVVGGGSLPAGLSFNGIRTISGTPQAAGMTRLLMTATNAANAASGGPKSCVILTITGGEGVDAYGIPDSWKVQYFGSATAPGSGALADPDGDGMTNLAEFKAGTIPTDSRSVLAIGGAALGSGADKFVVSWDSVSGKSYGVDKRTNLTGGAWQSVAGGIPGNPPVNAYTDSVGSTPGGYYRVKVE